MLIGLNNKEKLADASQKLRLMRPNSVLALANFMSLVAYVVQKANAAALDVSRPPEDAENSNVKEPV